MEASDSLTTGSKKGSFEAVKWNFRKFHGGEKVPVMKIKLEKSGTLELCGTLESSGLSLRESRR